MITDLPQCSNGATTQSLDENAISHILVGCALEVHRTLGGPGLLESVYEEALCFELAKAGLTVSRQVQLPINYKGRQLANPLKIDVLLNNKVIIECKATTACSDIYEVQLRTYLRLQNLKLGLALNFGERLVKDGIDRVVNNL